MSLIIDEDYQANGSEGSKTAISKMHIIRQQKSPPTKHLLDQEEELSPLVISHDSLSQASETCGNTIAREALSLVQHPYITSKLRAQHSRLSQLALMAFHSNDHSQALKVASAILLSFLTEKGSSWLVERRLGIFHQWIEELQSVQEEDKKEFLELGELYWETADPIYLCKFSAKILSTKASKEDETVLFRCHLSFFNGMSGQEARDDKARLVAKITDGAKALFSHLKQELDTQVRSRHPNEDLAATIDFLPLDLSKMQPRPLRFAHNTFGSKIEKLASDFRQSCEKYFSPKHLEHLLQYHIPEGLQNEQETKALQRSIQILIDHSADSLEAVIQQLSASTILRAKTCRKNKSRLEESCALSSSLVSEICLVICEHLEVFQEAIKHYPDEPVGSEVRDAYIRQRLHKKHALHDSSPRDRAPIPEDDEAFILHHLLPRLENTLGSQGAIWEILKAAVPELAELNPDGLGEDLLLTLLQHIPARLAKRAIAQELRQFGTSRQLNATLVTKLDPRTSYHEKILGELREKAMLEAVMKKKDPENRRKALFDLVSFMKPSPLEDLFHQDILRQLKDPKLAYHLTSLKSHDDLKRFLKNFLSAEATFCHNLKSTLHEAVNVHLR